MKIPLISLEIVLGFIVPLGWGAWELFSLRRERRRDAGAKPDASSSKPRVREPTSARTDAPPA